MMMSQFELAQQSTEGVIGEYHQHGTEAENSEDR